METAALRFNGSGDAIGFSLSTLAAMQNIPLA